MIGPFIQAPCRFHDWIRHFNNLLDGHSYFAFGTHDFVTSLSPSKRLKAWENILQIAIKEQSVIVTFSEAAELFKTGDPFI